MAQHHEAETVLKWILLAFGVLFFVPRLLASISANNARLKAQTSPGAALRAQEAQAINTAGNSLSKALGDALKQALGQGSAKGSASGGGGAGGAGMPKDSQQKKKAEPSIFSVFDPRKWVKGATKKGYPNYYAFDPDSVADVPAPAVGELLSFDQLMQLPNSSVDTMESLWSAYDPLAGVTLAAPDAQSFSSDYDPLSLMEALYGQPQAPTEQVTSRITFGGEELANSAPATVEDLGEFAFWDYGSYNSNSVGGYGGDYNDGFGQWDFGFGY